MARPKKVIDENLVFQLASIHCTNSEIAAVVGCDESLVRKRFSEIVTKGKEQGKMSLRRAMFKKAIDGNATLMIWLSKQYLGMTDKNDITSNINGELSLTDLVKSLGK